MKFRLKIVLLEVVSIAAVTIPIIDASSIIVRDAISHRVKETLHVAAEGFYGDINYLSDTDYGIHVTLFDSDGVRTESTIANVVGKPADSEIIDSVLRQGKTRFLEDILVGDEKFFGYYTPYKDGMLFVGKSRRIVLEIMRNVLKYTIIISIVVSALCLAVMYIIITKLTKVIKHVNTYIGSLADLDISKECAESTRKDEFGDIQNSVRKVTSAMRNVLQSVQSDSKHLGESCDLFESQFNAVEESVKQASAAITDIATSSTAQAHEVTCLEDGINNISSVINESSDCATALSGIADTVSKFADNTDSMIDDLKRASEESSQDVDDIAIQLQESHDSAQQIRAAVDLIQSIAQKTNLLAINASIEAAHAGDSGKGFAVVADEIKLLAEGSSNAVKEINDVVAHVLDDSVRSTTKASKLQNTITEQLSCMSNLSDSFTALHLEIKSINDAIGVLNNQIESLRENRTTLLDSSSQLAAISEENAAASEEVDASLQMILESLHECSTQLGNMLSAETDLRSQIERFKL